MFKQCLAQLDALLALEQIGARRSFTRHHEIYGMR